MRNLENPSPTYLVYQAEQNGKFFDTETFIWPENDPRSIMCRDELLGAWSGTAEVLYWGTDRSAARDAISKVSKSLQGLVEEISLG